MIYLQGIALNYKIYRSEVFQKMKRIICLLLTLCLLAACSLAWAEDQSAKGVPFTNPNMYDSFPEWPGPEENFVIYADYDEYVRAADGIDTWKDGFVLRLNHCVGQEIVDICLNPEYTDTESEIIRILYKLAADTEKLDREGLAPLMAKVDRVKAVKTLDELTALIGEKGFLFSTPILYCLTTESAGLGMYVVSVSKSPLLDNLEMTDEEIEANDGPLPDKETPRKRLIEMQYSEEEAERLVEEIERYDNAWPEDPENWPVDQQLFSLKEIREKCQPLYMMLEGTGLVLDDNETKPVYEIDSTVIGTFMAWYKEENLETLKAMVALKLYHDAMPFLDQEKYLQSQYKANGDDSLIILFKRIKNAATVPTNQAYITHCCPEEKWGKAISLFGEIKQALRARIEASTWVSEESKAKCLERLDDMILQPIIPPGGNFSCEPLLAALQGCESLPDAACKCAWFNNQCMMRFTGEPADSKNIYIYSLGGLFQDNWGYLPTKNMFSLGAAALCDAVSDFSSRETLLGSIGMNIGHEVSHAYDLQNVRSDYTGTDSLITEEEYRTMAEMMKSIAGQLSRIETGKGQYMNGEASCIEAMADLEGLRLVLDLAKQEENFDYEAFFNAYAKCWFCYDKGLDYGPDNPHPADYVRVNFTVQHMDEFYQTYPSVTEGTPMYIAPEDRILVW